MWEGCLGNAEKFAPLTSPMLDRGSLTTTLMNGMTRALDPPKEGVMTRDFTRILVPTDFSAPSNGALASAKTLATRFGASLHLLHVLDDPFVAGAFAADVYAPPPAGLRESWLKGAETLLATQLAPEEKADFHSTTAVVFGPPARAIVEYAGTHGIDLIVMGTHGRGGMAHLLIGSVAERVVRTALCPVMTVREELVESRQAELTADQAASTVA